MRRPGCRHLSRCSTPTRPRSLERSAAAALPPPDLDRSPVHRRWSSTPRATPQRRQRPWSAAAAAQRQRGRPLQQHAASHVSRVSPFVSSARAVHGHVSTDPQGKHKETPADDHKKHNSTEGIEIDAITTDQTTEKGCAMAPSARDSKRQPGSVGCTLEEFYKLLGLLSSATTSDGATRRIQHHQNVAVERRRWHHSEQPSWQSPCPRQSDAAEDGRE
jgi:hypothetical protein